MRGAARGSWSVPLLVDARRARLSGELFRVDPPASWPWLAIGGFFAAVALLLLALRSQRLLRVGAASTAVFVDVLRHDEEPIPLDRFSTEA